MRGGVLVQRAGQVARRVLRSAEHWEPLAQTGYPMWRNVE